MHFVGKGELHRLGGEGLIHLVGDGAAAHRAGDADGLPAVGSLGVGIARAGDGEGDAAGGRRTLIGQGDLVDVLGGVEGIAQRAGAGPNGGGVAVGPVGTGAVGGAAHRLTSLVIDRAAGGLAAVHIAGGGHADGGGDVVGLTKDLRRAVDDDLAGLVIDLGVRFIPGDRELGGDHRAVRHDGGTGGGQRGDLTHLNGGGVVEQGHHVVQHHNAHGNGDVVALDGAGDGKLRTRRGQEALVVCVPRDRPFRLRAVAQGNGGGFRQVGFGVELDVDGLGQVVAHGSVITSLGSRTAGGNGDGGGGQAGGGGGDGEGALLLGGLDNGHQTARARLAGVGGVGGVVGLHAVVQTHELTIAGDGDLDLRRRAVDDLALGVHHVDGDVGEVAAVVLDGLAVGGSHQLGGPRGGADHAAAHGVGNGRGGRLALKGLDLQRARLIGNVEGGIHGGAGQVAAVVGRTGGKGVGPAVLQRRSLIGAVLVTGGGGGLVGFCRANLHAVEVHTHHGGVGVGNHLHRAVADHQVLFVPGGQDVEGGVGLVPHGAVEIVAVLGDAVGVDDAEEGTLGGVLAVDPAGPGTVVGRRLTDVVEAGPDILAHVVVKADGVPPRARSGVAPAHPALVIGGEELVAVQRLVALDVVNTAGVDVGGGLRAVGEPAVAVGGRHLVTAGIGTGIAVVEADHAIRRDDGVDPLRDAGIPGGGGAGIVAHGDGAGGVDGLDPVSQVLGIGHEALVGAGLQDLVAQRVHDDAGGILVPVHHGLQHELRPDPAFAAHDGVVVGDLSVEEAGEVVTVAVLGTVPAVKGLVDDEDALAVADLD